MRKRSLTYGALTAAVLLACGAVNAQDDELTEAERAEIERENQQLEQRTEQLEQQTEALEEGTEEIADQRELNERRQELVQMAEETLDQLREQNPSAAALYDQAYGHAVFDTTKGGLIVTGAGGTGVAMEKGGTEPIFMHLGQAGIGLGAGLENYRLVLLIADEQTYREFVSGQWDGSISAQASAGEEGVSAEEPFVEGIRAFRLTDAGLMAQVDVSGVRIWRSEELNDLELAEAEGADAQDFDDADEEAEEAVEETEEAVQDAEDRL